MTETHTPATGGQVLVGVDDSEGAALALDYAFDEAVRRGWSLRVVLAYEEPYPWVSAEGLVLPPDDLHADAKKEADRIVETAVQARRDRGVAIPATTVEALAGTASTVLVRESAHADVLVVGHRGRGGAASRLIGSVGLNCVVHAECTVIVVRN